MIFKQDKIEATQEDRTLNWRQNIQHNDTQHSGTQHNGLQYNGTQYICGVSFNAKYCLSWVAIKSNMLY
jgi:hypothetical protein